jgi:hypothetical protein
MLKRPQRKANATASPVRISGAVVSSVCVRLYASTAFVLVSHPRQPSSVTGLIQPSPVPRKIAWYVSSGLCPVARTTSPPMRNANNAVSIGVTIPPARW